MQSSPVHANFQGHSSDSNNTIKAQKEVAAYLKTPKARVAIEADIQNLSDIMISIEDHFATIASQMYILDEKTLVSHKFAPKWRDLHDEYTALKQESVCSANDISCKIGALIKNVVPALQDDISLDDKKGILAEYITDLQQFQPKAKINATHFLRLGQKVTAFKDFLKDKVVSEKKEMVNKFKEIEERLAKLESDLEKLSGVSERGRNVVKTIWPFGDKFNTGEVAAITTLADIAPTVGKKLMEIALRYLNPALADDLKKMQQDLEDDLKKLRQDLDDGRKKPHQDLDVTSIKQVLSNLRVVCEHQRVQVNTEFSEVLQDVVKLEPTFKGITEKLDKIQGIWLLLLKDSHSLTDTLSQMTTTKFKVVFDRYATILTDTYEALQFCLDRYTLAVKT